MTQLGLRYVTVIFLQFIIIHQALDMLDSFSRQRMLWAGNCWRMRLIAINARLFERIAFYLEIILCLFIFTTTIIACG